jgi:hypothetical protein
MKPNPFPFCVQTKAEQVLTRLQDGWHWSQLGGRKLHYTNGANNPVVVFELPAWHRLVCWLKNGLIARSELMTHERYNSFAANTRR